MPPSAIIGTPASLSAAGNVLDRGDLRHTHAGNDTRGADRARADADLDAVGTVVDQRLGSGRGGDVAADHLDLREIALDPLDAVEHALRVTVRGVDHQHVHAGFDQRGGTLLGALAHADRRARRAAGPARPCRRSDARRTSGCP